MSDLAQSSLASANPVETMFAAAPSMASTSDAYMPSGESRELASSFVSSMAGSSGEEAAPLLKEPGSVGKDVSKIATNAVSILGQALDAVDKTMADSMSTSGADEGMSM